MTNKKLNEIYNDVISQTNNGKFTNLEEGLTYRCKTCNSLVYLQYNKCCDKPNIERLYILAADIKKLKKVEKDNHFWYELETSETNLKITGFEKVKSEKYNCERQSKYDIIDTKDMKIGELKYEMGYGFIVWFDSQRFYYLYDYIKESKPKTCIEIKKIKIEKEEKEKELKKEIEKNFPKCPECEKPLTIWGDGEGNEYLYCDKCKLVLRPMALHQEKTREQVEDLKRQWLEDGCWDLPTSEGFEDYYDELVQFEKETEEKFELEKKQKEETMKIIKEIINEIGIEGVYKQLLGLMTTVDKLTNAVYALCDSKKQYAHQLLREYLYDKDQQILDKLKGGK